VFKKLYQHANNYKIFRTKTETEGRKVKLQKIINHQEIANTEKHLPTVEAVKALTERAVLERLFNIKSVYYKTIL
jgi:hypothetical protein